MVPMLGNKVVVLLPLLYMYHRLKSLSVMFNFMSVISAQQAHDVRMTSDRRRCDVMASHRRWYDVRMTSCARWGKSFIADSRQSVQL